MNSFKLFQVFTDDQSGLTGNTSTVVLMTTLPGDHTLQKIASDLCQPATTFLFPTANKNEFNIRWFAPDAEIHLCGHGSLAGICFLSELYPSVPDFRLSYPGGAVTGKKIDKNQCSIRLGAFPVIRELEVPGVLYTGLGIPVEACFETGNKLIVLARSESEVKGMQPDFGILRQSDTFGYIVTSPGKSADFGSRTLIPHVQQLEDPATGSSHAALVPFWSKRLHKEELTGIQWSKRGGLFKCSLDKDEVVLTGQYKELASGNLSSYS